MEKMRLQPLARGHAGVAIPAIDDRQPESTRRHRMQGWIALFVERDLNARDTRHAQYFFHERWRRVTKALSIRTEDRNAESIAQRAVCQVPHAAIVERDHRIDPALA